MASAGRYHGVSTECSVRNDITAATARAPSPLHGKDPAIFVPRPSISGAYEPNIRPPYLEQASHFPPPPSTPLSWIDTAFTLLSRNRSLDSSSPLPPQVISEPVSNSSSPLPTPATFSSSSSLETLPLHSMHLASPMAKYQPLPMPCPSATTAMDFGSPQTVPLSSTPNINHRRNPAIPFATKIPLSPISKSSPMARSTSSAQMTPVLLPTPPPSLGPTMCQTLPSTPISQASPPAPVYSPSPFTPVPIPTAAPAASSNSAFAQPSQPQRSSTTPSTHRNRHAHPLPGTSGSKLTPSMTERKYISEAKQMLRCQTVLLREILFFEKPSLKKVNEAPLREEIWKRWLEDTQKQMHKFCPVASTKVPCLDPHFAGSGSAAQALIHQLHMITVETAGRDRTGITVSDEMRQVRSWCIHLRFLKKQIERYKACRQMYRDAAARLRSEKDCHGVSGQITDTTKNNVGSVHTNASDLATPATVTNVGRSDNGGLVRVDASDITTSGEGPTAACSAVTDPQSDKLQAPSCPSGTTQAVQNVVNEDFKTTISTQPRVDTQCARPQFLYLKDTQMQPCTPSPRELTKDSDLKLNLKRRWPFREVSMEPERPIYFTESDPDVVWLLRGPDQTLSVPSEPALMENPDYGSMVNETDGWEYGSE